MDKGKNHSAFTLIEVMVSVMIISSVIMALLKMYADNTHIFSMLKQKTELNQYATFFIANKDYGLEKDEVKLYDLVENFKLEDELRRELKDKKVTILYQKLESIDLSQFEDQPSQESDDSMIEYDEKEVNSNIVFEVGKTIVKVDNSSVGYLRLHLQ
jgi:prepilin-type N-terminal cleavage/methylation domain-containing protein